MAGLQKKANIDDETIKDVRIYETHGSKIHKIYHEESNISSISEFVALYAEVTPEEEKHLAEGEVMISCYHYDKEPNKPHGVPFRFVVRPVNTCIYIIPDGVNLDNRGRCLMTQKIDCQSGSA